MTVDGGGVIVDGGRVIVGVGVISDLGGEGPVAVGGLWVGWVDMGKFVHRGLGGTVLSAVLEHSVLAYRKMCCSTLQSMGCINIYTQHGMFKRT